MRCELLKNPHVLNSDNLRTFHVRLAVHAWDKQTIVHRACFARTTSLSPSAGLCFTPERMTWATVLQASLRSRQHRCC